MNKSLLSLTPSCHSSLVILLRRCQQSLLFFENTKFYKTAFPLTLSLPRVFFYRLILSYFSHCGLNVPSTTRLLWPFSQSKYLSHTQTQICTHTQAHEISVYPCYSWIVFISIWHYPICSFTFISHPHLNAKFPKVGDKLCSLKPKMDSVHKKNSHL